MTGIDTYDPRWSAALRLLAGACETAGEAAQGRREAGGDAGTLAAATMAAAHARDAAAALRGAADAAQIGGRWGGMAQGEAWADWPTRCADALRRAAAALDAGVADVPPPQTEARR